MCVCVCVCVCVKLATAQHLYGNDVNKLPECLERQMQEDGNALTGNVVAASDH